ncbi:hypothetical protein AVEN_34250-1 [Araneus ventricosus]|uniref:Uncharacterized protein n=1 Tax=Araneus ventricosus TaxID=182803 RepID=A0A4Y2MP03_ARAVE|nr:hypothetical protein AVEN_34250-1 [Araneus ventricosus]
MALHILVAPHFLKQRANRSSRKTVKARIKNLEILSLKWPIAQLLRECLPFRLLMDPGQNEWITDRRVTGKSSAKDALPKIIPSSSRRVYRRNRKHLIPSPDFHPEPGQRMTLMSRDTNTPADADPGCPPPIIIVSKDLP